MQFSYILNRLCIVLDQALLCMFGSSAFVHVYHLLSFLIFFGSTILSALDLQSKLQKLRFLPSLTTILPVTILVGALRKVLINSSVQRMLGQLFENWTSRGLLRCVFQSAVKIIYNFSLPYSRKLCWQNIWLGKSDATSEKISHFLRKLSPA